jgi:hypothetical protein
MVLTTGAVIALGLIYLGASRYDYWRFLQL